METTYYTSREETANTITHGLGALAGGVASLALIALTATSGDGWRLASAIIYSISLVLLYTTSTLYHGAHRPAAKAQLEKADHCAIFVLIAGTYTPFTLVSLRGAWGWTLFGIIWGLAIAGVLLKLRFMGRFHLLSTLTYLAMGWLVVVAAVPLVQALPLSAIILLVVGGLLYSGGTLFYHNERLPYAHAIWHLFVLGGSICHFVAVSTQVLPS